MKLKKSGKNSFAGYDYFELQDFLPQINKLFLDHQLIGLISFTVELATLKIINTEKPDEVLEFTSPMAEANLKGCHPIQNLGAVQSYQRRYLYVTALEIVEHDKLDATTGKENGHSEVAAGKEQPRKPAPPEQKPDSMTDKQRGKMMATMRDKNITKEQVVDYIGVEFGKESTKELTLAESSRLIEWLEAKEAAA